MKKFREYVIGLVKAGFDARFVWMDFVQKKSKKWKNISLDEGRFIILSTYHDLKQGCSYEK